MKISFITPTKYIEKYQGQGDFILALSHLLTSVQSFTIPNEYEKEILKTGLPIILDNGCFENHAPESIDDLFAKARRIKAKIFFAPDYLYNAEKTMNSLNNTAYILRSFPDPKPKIGVVIQADNPKDYIECYKQAVEDPNVSLIGLSILAIPKSFEITTGTKDITYNRIECLRQLNDLSKHKDSHLLGAGSSYKDVEYAQAYCPWVVSHDSSSAFWNSVQGKRIQEDLSVEGGKTPIPVDFDYSKPLTKTQRGIIQSNIERIKDICHR